MGCLTLRRARRAREPENGADFWSKIFHPMGTSGYWLLLATHAYDDGSARCPALASDGRCGIEHDCKPANCSAAPLDPLAPSARQAEVLAKRAAQAAYFAANCIAAGARSATNGSRALPLIVDGGLTSVARQSLEASRRQLELDRRFWGDAVFRQLPSELLESSLVPTDGFLSISIVPVLRVVARLSEGCRQRCLAYLDAQAVAIDAALARLPAHAIQAQRQLSGFAENGLMLRRLLLNSPGEPSSVAPPRDVRSIERWLDTGSFEEVGAAPWLSASCGPDIVSTQATPV